MRIALIGPPGSGKGTYAQLLEARGWKRITIGDLLRKEAKKNTPLGRKIRKLINAGKLVPSKIIFTLIKKELKRVKNKNIVFDGMPRTLTQARFLSKLNVDKVFLIKVSKQKILQRLKYRLQCPKCGRTYNTKTNPPKKKGICDFCKEKLVRREDEKIIQRRLKEYKQHANKIISYLKKQNNLYILDGERPIKKVFSDLEKLLNK